MVNDDTIKLLKECNAGVKTAVTSIDEVFPSAKNTKLRDLLTECKKAHETLGDETHILLEKYHDSEKDPSTIAKAMSWMKINMKLLQESSDREVADLMTDGCNMGTKSLYRYLNQYVAAEEQVKQIAKNLITLEENLIRDLRQYL